MNGNDHLFTIIDFDEFSSFFDFNDILSKKSNNVIFVPNEIISYINDTLKWLNTINPVSSSKSFLGLNLFGPTIIEPSEISKFVSICEVWVNLFEFAPEDVHLTGDWVSDIDDMGNEGEGYYEDIFINRSHLIQYIQNIINLSRLAGERDGYILHYGL
ncbi:hypothetical protein F8S13_03010 [Chloroflexia bacterium SDU3-3]|nr:hypothetical protein F8S13_03010 [Chloroflexia bacterium SDU3-3]